MDVVEKTAILQKDYLGVIKQLTDEIIRLGNSAQPLYNRTNVMTKMDEIKKWISEATKGMYQQEEYILSNNTVLANTKFYKSTPNVVS
jgi:hypothetical protein